MQYFDALLDAAKSGGQEAAYAWINTVWGDRYPNDGSRQSYSVCDLVPQSAQGICNDYFGLGSWWSQVCPFWCPIEGVSFDNSFWMQFSNDNGFAPEYVAMAQMVAGGAVVAGSLALTIKAIMNCTKRSKSEKEADVRDALQYAAEAVYENVVEEAEPVLINRANREIIAKAKEIWTSKKHNEGRADPYPDLVIPNDADKPIVFAGPRAQYGTASAKHFVPAKDALTRVKNVVDGDRRSKGIL